MFVVHIFAPILRYAKRSDFKAHIVRYKYPTKALKCAGMVDGCMGQF